LQRIVGFIHIYAVNNYREIVERQVKRIIESGLYQAAEKIYYVVIGDNDYRIEGDKFIVLGLSPNMQLTETFTLNALRRVVLTAEEDYKVFYIHTKGVTRKIKSIDLWSMYMEYFIIDKFIFCLDALKKADATGCNRRVYAKTRVHFSGNFWWANSSYIKKLPELSVEGYGREVNRWDGEFWIGDGNPVTIQLWNSRVHHQRVQYGPNNYEGKSPNMKLFKKRKI
jgi:hypothetical protein